MPEEKDLRYFKNEAAKDIGYNDYQDYAMRGEKQLLEPEHDDWEFHIALIGSAAEKYASYKVRQAKEEAWEEGFNKGVVFIATKGDINPYSQKEE